MAEKRVEWELSQDRGPGALLLAAGLPLPRPASPGQGATPAIPLLLPSCLAGAGTQAGWALSPLLNQKVLTELVN